MTRVTSLSWLQWYLTFWESKYLGRNIIKHSIKLRTNLPTYSSVMAMGVRGQMPPATVLLGGADEEALHDNELNHKIVSLWYPVPKVVYILWCPGTGHYGRSLWSTKATIQVNNIQTNIHTHTYYNWNCLLLLHIAQG